jgi:hypothetical protein
LRNNRGKILSGKKDSRPIRRKACPSQGEGAAELQPLHTNRNLKGKTHIFETPLMCNAVRDLPFSLNQALKSADDWYTEVLKNKERKFKMYYVKLNNKLDIST